jgi:thiamine pyrophosphokinase
MKQPIVILANGDFPKHEIPFKILKKAGSIICCDGSMNNLAKHGLEPIAIIGDLDSLDEKHKIKHQKKLFHTPDQNQNDLRKAMQWIEKQNINHVTILGATGKREDHTLGNIFSLIEFQTKTKFNMITDYGIFTTIENEKKFKSFKGEQVSIFSTNPKIKITSTGLKYNLNNYMVSDLYSCALNESNNGTFNIKISKGKIIVYQAFKDK